jgi:hypothetical protein
LAVDSQTPSPSAWAQRTVSLRSPPAAEVGQRAGTMRYTWRPAASSTCNQDFSQAL